MIEVIGTIVVVGLVGFIAYRKWESKRRKSENRGRAVPGSRGRSVDHK